MGNSFNSILMGAAGTSGAGIGDGPFWINQQYGGDDDAYLGITSDSNNNVIVSGLTKSDGAGSQDGFVTKFTNEGALTFTKTYGGSANDSSSDVKVDSSDNIYVSGFLSYDWLTAKFNSSFSKQWQNVKTSTQHPGSAYDVGDGSAIDSNNKIYTCGYARTQQASYDQGFWSRYDADGSNFISRSLLGTNTSNGFCVWYNMDVDPSGNVFLAGVSNFGSSGYVVGVVAKYNSSAALQWQRKIGPDANLTYLRSVAVDADGTYIYAAGYTTTHGSGQGATCILLKYNTSGSLQWQRGFASSGDTSDVWTDVQVHNGLVYVFGTVPTGPGTENWVIAQYDTSGNLIFKRTFGNNSSTSGTRTKSARLDFDSTGAMLLCGRTYGNTYAVCAKLPNDGSLVGTYGSGNDQYIYADSSGLTSFTTNLAEAAHNGVDSSITLDAHSETGNVADAVLTETRQAVS